MERKASLMTRTNGGPSKCADLGDQYEAAWDEWYASLDAAMWDATLADGLDDE